MLVSREMQTQATIRYYLTPVRMPINKKTRGTWVAWLVKCLTSAQVMISLFWVQAPRWALC